VTSTKPFCVDNDRIGLFVERKSRSTKFAIPALDLFRMMQKILAVDDSELLHRMYDLILMRYRREGAEVLHAHDGREALDLLTRQPDIELILLDINMPVMGGLEFLTLAQARGLLTDVAVLIISTEGKQDDTLLGLRRGAHGYLTKPFQPNDLYALIDRIFPTDVSPTAKTAR